MRHPDINNTWIAHVAGGITRRDGDVVGAALAVRPLPLGSHTNVIVENYDIA